MTMKRTAVALLGFALQGLASQRPLKLKTATAAMYSTMNATRRLNPNFKPRFGTAVLSAKDMLELPRPGEGKINGEGDLVLVPVSEYSFEGKKNEKSFYLASLSQAVPPAPLQVPLARGGDVFWLDARTVGHVVASEDETVQELYAVSVKVEAETEGGAAVLSTPEPPTLVGHLPTSPGSPAGNFVYRPAAGALVFSAYVYGDYDLSTVKEQDDAYEGRGNTGLVYDETFVRHWDTWVGPKRQALFVGRLAKGADGTWTLGDAFNSPLKPAKHWAPVEPFGGTDDYAVSDKYVVYTTKAPGLPEAAHTKQNIYITSLFGGEMPRELTTGTHGATHAPAFSPSGDQVAWLEMAEDGYESDRSQIVLFDLESDTRHDLAKDWDRSPSSLAFSHDGKQLYLATGSEARVKIFVLDITSASIASTSSPTPLVESGAASGLQPLPAGGLVFTRSSLTSPNDVFVLSASDIVHKKAPRQVTSFAAKKLAGKHLDAGRELFWQGAKQTIQGWVLTPPGFKKGEDKKWPVVMLIHGGPQGAWEDQWSTRWNPTVWASAGYVVFAPNPTGSTTFGQALTDAIAGDWGGAPFTDLRAGWKALLEAYPEADPERAVAAGASWGGYAINWIQGHPEYDFGFKALMSHDGVFDARYNGFTTDELFFFGHEWGGRPWDESSKKLSEKMSPANFVHKWSTPMMLVHGSKDYRLPETESIGAFHALQMREIPSRLLVFPDENHWVLDHGNSLKWHYEVFRWLDEWVGKDD